MTEGGEVPKDPEGKPPKKSSLLQAGNAENWTGNKQEDEKKKFEPSVLFQEETELTSITDPDLRRKAESLHKIASSDPNMEAFNRDQWVKQYEKICDLMADGQVPTDEGVQLATALNKMIKKHDKSLRKKAKEIQGASNVEKSNVGELNSNRIEELLKKLLSNSTSERKMQEAQYELMKGGYEGFFHAERVRAYVNPEQFDASLPKWYKDLPAKDQDEIRMRMWINYGSAIKRDNGMTDLDPVMKVNFLLERRVLDHMWENTPGLRVALATVIHDVFDSELDHLVITGKNEGGEEKATGGYRYIGSEEKRLAYREKLTKGLTAYLEPHRDKLEKKYKVKLELLAQSTVSFVDNLLFFSGAYDSGDERRSITPGDSNVYSEQMRTFFMPGIKGEKKWLGGSSKEDKEKGVAEERFGGPLGEWMRINARLSPDFKEKFKGKKGIITLIPPRLYYSLLDQTYFKDGATTLAQKLLETEKEEVKGGDITMFKFKDPNAIDFKDLKSSNIFGSYADTRSGALKIYKHLTSKSTDDRIKTPGDLVDALFKARKDPMLNKIYRDKYLVLACLINKISPNGLVLGTQELVLNIGEPTYDTDVYNALLDSRLYEGVKPGFRDWVIKELHAEDMTTSSSLGYYFTIPSTVRKERRKIRMRALKTMEKQSHS